MNVGILHFHLERGGVTRVIVNHLHSLDVTHAGPPLPVRLVHGPRRSAWPNDLDASLANVRLAHVVVPGFDYDQGTSFDPRRLGEALLAALRVSGFDPPDTVLHVHNHSLGKNLALPFALRALATAGFGLLLHVHDFAEDFRPANYERLAIAYDGRVAERLYPHAPRVHYAVLNRRDFEALSLAGVPPERLHFLPNPVPMPEQTVDREAARTVLLERFGVPRDRPYLLYPVRAIRRKNLGEAVLWSALLGDDATVGITLAPLNPTEREPYDRWTTFAQEHDLSIRFGTGEEGGLSFAENLAAADAVLTTSVAEGFGMAFLEPWTFDRPLVGRNLPEITADFVDEGLELGGLYDRLPIPLDWIGRETFASALRDAARSVAESYGHTFDHDQLSAALADKCRGDRVDFGDLDESMQRTVIERVVTDPTSAGHLRDALEPVIASVTAPSSDVAANRRIVATRYSPESCGHRLRLVYATILAESPATSDLPSLPRAHGLLDSFVAPTRLRLLRT